MIKDCMTKPLTGRKLHSFDAIILNLSEDSSILQHNRLSTVVCRNYHFVTNSENHFGENTCQEPVLLF